MQSTLLRLGSAFLLIVTSLTCAAAAAAEATKATNASAVDASIGAGSLLTTLASLGAVIATILVFAAFAKRYSLGRATSGNALHTVASLAVGPKERVLVVEFRDRQLVLGATSQQITLLASLEKPVQAEPQLSAASAPTSEPSTADALVKKWVSKLTDRSN
jgi:flagellar protein FliO/FliZ